MLGNWFGAAITSVKFVADAHDIVSMRNEMKAKAERAKAKAAAPLAPAGEEAVAVQQNPQQPKDEKTKVEDERLEFTQGKEAGAKEAAKTEAALKAEREKDAALKAKNEAPQIAKVQSKEDKKKAEEEKTEQDRAKLKSDFDKALEEQKKKPGLSWESIGGGITDAASSAPISIIKDVGEGLVFAKDVGVGTYNLGSKVVNAFRGKKDGTIELSAGGSTSMLELASQALDASKKLKEARAASTIKAVAASKPPETEQARRERGIVLATDILKNQEELWKTRRDLIPPPSVSERLLAKEANEKKIDTEAAINAQAKCNEYDKELKKCDDELKAIKEKKAAIEDPKNPERQKLAAEILSQDLEAQKKEAAKLKADAEPGDPKYNATMEARNKDFQDKQNLIDTLKKPPTSDIGEKEAVEKSATAKATAAKTETEVATKDTKDAQDKTAQDAITKAKDTVKESSDKTAAEKVEPKPEPKPETKTLEPKTAEIGATASSTTATTSPVATSPAEKPATSAAEPAKGSSEPSTPSSDSSSKPSSGGEGSAAAGGDKPSGMSQKVGIAAAKEGLKVADKLLDVASGAVKVAEKVLPSGLSPMLEGAKQGIGDAKQAVSMGQDALSGKANVVDAAQKPEAPSAQSQSTATAAQNTLQQPAAAKPAAPSSQPVSGSPSPMTATSAPKAAAANDAFSPPDHSQSFGEQFKANAQKLTAFSDNGNQVAESKRERSASTPTPTPMTTSYNTQQDAFKEKAHKAAEALRERRASDAEIKQKTEELAREHRSQSASTSLSPH